MTSLMTLIKESNQGPGSVAQATNSVRCRCLNRFNRYYTLKMMIHPASY